MVVFDQVHGIPKALAVKRLGWLAEEIPQDRFLHPLSYSILTSRLHSAVDGPHGQKGPNGDFPIRMLRDDLIDQVDQIELFSLCPEDSDLPKSGVFDLQRIRNGCKPLDNGLGRSEISLVDNLGFPVDSLRGHGIIIGSTMNNLFAKGGHD
jgi:hypothetical protein